ncbi:MAG: hypothetical protein V9E87_11745 [Gemmatimonadales bacterium]
MTRMKWNALDLTRPALLAAVLLTVACGTSRKPTEPEGPKAPTPAAADSLAGKPGDATAAAGAGASADESRRTVQPNDSAWAAAATSPLTLRFDAIGYKSGITLLGSLDEASLTIPVNAGLAPSAVTLNIIPTPGMPAATLVLQQRDRVLAQRALTDTTTFDHLPARGHHRRRWAGEPLARVGSAGSRRLRSAALLSHRADRREPRRLHRRTDRTRCDQRLLRAVGRHRHLLPCRTAIT